VWNALSDIIGHQSQWKAAGDHYIQSLERLRSTTSSTPEGQDWETYLLFDEMLSMWKAGPDRDDKHLRHLIEQFADRWENPELSAAQRAMFAQNRFADLHTYFGDWAAATVDLEILCKAIEAHEERGGELYATRIAADARLLSLSTNPTVRSVADVIDRHYGSPNLRLAIADQFLQRLVPEQPLVAEPVRETIAGAAVAGRSLTEADVRVLLIPDPNYWRIGLEVSGNVASATSSSSGPATLHSAGQTAYLARKLIVLTPAGLYSFPAVAGAQAENMLRAINTSFDGIPLIEGLVRSVVVSQHEKNRPQAMEEVESKISHKARQRLDSQTDERLQHAAARVRKHIWNPLVELGLKPRTVQMETTADRITTEMVLATNRQLAAHTSRPYALADSLLSLQVHQSAMNNLLQQLGLADRELTLPELYETVAAKLGREKSAVPEDLSRSARVHFARRDPISVSLHDGRVRVTLSLREVKDGRHRFVDFKVHAFYRPQINGFHVELIRDGIIEIEGRALPAGDYVVLQGIFVSLFSQSRPLSLIPTERNGDTRLEGLMVTQLVLDNEWLGIAIGPGHPQRTAIMTRTVR
jgi:hypothetical protein